MRYLALPGPYGYVGVNSDRCRMSKTIQCVGDFRDCNEGRAVYTIGRTHHPSNEYEQSPCLLPMSEVGYAPKPLGAFGSKPKTIRLSQKRDYLASLKLSE